MGQPLNNLPFKLSDTNTDIYNHLTDFSWLGLLANHDRALPQYHSES